MATAVSEVVQRRIVSVGEIHVDRPYDPVDHTSRARLAGLTTAIVAHGLTDALTVRPAVRGYELVDGRKRLAACRDAGITAVPVVIDHDQAA